MPKALFRPKFPDKYAGDSSRIIARSSWELIYMRALDNSPVVAKWISEPKTLNISYLSPIDRKVHQYWPDFLVQYINGDIEILEIKPAKESLAEESNSLYDKLMLVKNVAKWHAADKFAKSIGARFRVITEKQMFANKTAKQSRRPRGTRGTVRTRGTR